MAVVRLARWLVVIAATVGCAVVVRPVPPGPGRFMWQNVQMHFTRNGEPCVGRVTLAVSDRAVCYAASDGDLHCAGAVHQRDFGSRFIATGLGDVDQVFLSGTWNTPDGNGMCILRHDGKLFCMGDANRQGEFGIGTRGPTTHFVPWEVPKALARIATGTWNQLCAVDTGDTVRCAGQMSEDCSTYRTEDRPTVQDGGAAHRTVWVDECGRRNYDPAAVFRVSAGRSTCRVRSGGLSCYEPPSNVPVAFFGEPGRVVDGFSTALPAPRSTQAYATASGYAAIHSRTER
ncbi:MAG TPA: hypothetical protein VKA21_01055 [Candidatus Binatia bacterium]|nr:hypothetical protein [Candidatus Binatia bacterium]